MYHTDIQQGEGSGYLSRATVSGRCVPNCAAVIGAASCAGNNFQIGRTFGF